MARTPLAAATGAASGKTILLGEHVVVHGRPALALGIARTVEVTVEPASTREVLGADDLTVKQATDLAANLAGIETGVGFCVRIRGDLPIAVGLGSSAALSVALVRGFAGATGVALTPEETAQRAHELEKLFHQTPSGIDGAVAAHGGLLWFEGGRQERLRAGGSASLVVALSGTRHSTRETVGGLRRRAAETPDAYEPLFDAIGRLVRSARTAIERGQWILLGRLMSMNHELLRAAGVSTPGLDALVALALDAGALGAKLTGAGGGGAAIALADGAPDRLLARLHGAGYEAFSTPLGATDDRS